MILNVYLDLPETFRVRAEYALETMLSAYDVQFQFCDEKTLLDNGGIFYGLKTPQRSVGGSKIVSIISRPETWAYFAAHQPFPSEKAFFVNHKEIRELPVLFGEDDIRVEGNDLFVHADIVASAFFWLSDWQQVYIADLDDLDRVPYACTLNKKLDIAQRPVVNEYAFLLAGWARFCDVEVSQRRWDGRDFALALSHDVQRLSKKDPAILRKETVENLLLNRQKLGLGGRIRRYALTLRDMIKRTDAYHDSLRQTLETEKSESIPSTYFFRAVSNASKDDQKDYLGDLFASEFGRLVDANGSEIGFLAGSGTGIQPELYRKEFRRLKRRTGKENVRVNRFSDYVFNVSDLFSAFTEQGIVADSSLAWVDHPGFRNGWCHPFRIFDIPNNKALDVFEIPLAASDIQLHDALNYSPDESMFLLKQQLQVVKRHGGVVCWSFRQNLYDEVEAPGWNNIFEHIISYAHMHNPYINSLERIYEHWCQPSLAE